MKRNPVMFYHKYKEFILYVFFGFFTFLIDVGVFFIISCFAELNKNAVLLHASSIFSTLFAVTFAYITNRKYVFNSRVYGFNGILKEMLEFYSARLFTLVISELLLDITVIHMGFTESLMKILINVIVITLNYILSKFWIFGKKHE